MGSLGFSDLDVFLLHAWEVSDHYLFKWAFCTLLRLGCVLDSGSGPKVSMCQYSGSYGGSGSEGTQWLQFQGSSAVSALLSPTGGSTLANTVEVLSGEGCSGHLLSFTPTREFIMEGIPLGTEL